MAYTDKELTQIVNYYKKREKPTKIRQASDVKQYPNDILMSYLIADTNPSKNDLVHLLNNPCELEEQLSLYIPEQVPFSKMPELDYGVEYSMPPKIISFFIEKKTKKFASGKEIKNALIIADKTKKEFTYPSGLKVEYYALTNEQSANESIFDPAYADVNTKEIYIRENSIKMMLAMVQVLKNTPDFRNYQEQIRDFEKHIKGMSIAHEKNELEIYKNRKTLIYQKELELKGEQKAKKFLEEQGVNIKYYELFHLTKSTQCKKRGKSISQVIVDQGFTPFL